MLQHQRPVVLNSITKSLQFFYWQKRAQEIYITSDNQEYIVSSSAAFFFSFFLVRSFMPARRQSFMLTQKHVGSFCFPLSINTHNSI